MSKLRTNIITSVVGILILISGPQAISADDLYGGGTYTLSMTRNYTPSPWTKRSGYLRRATHKLIFGVTFLALGWTELISEPHEAKVEGRSFFSGALLGVKHAAANTIGGFLHTATFPITNLDMPLPDTDTRLEKVREWIEQEQNPVEVNETEGAL